jgi:hypothetical protein
LFGFLRRTFTLLNADPNDANRGGATRTLNRRFWRPVLYQLSYTPSLHGPPTNKPQSKTISIYDGKEAANFSLFREPLL